jgi:microcystin-dependent protein
MKTIVKYTVLFSLLFGLGSTALAQLGVNNPNPDPSSVLDVKANNRGLLIPRMTTGLRQAMAIGTPVPAQGLLVFDTDENRIYFWDGSAWETANPMQVDSTGNNEIIRVASEMTIGGGFAAAAAPNNGLLVQGQTGLGTSTVNSDRLTVDGTTNLNGATTVNGNVNVSGTVVANNYTIPTTNNTNSPVPTGGIIMWNGSINSIPSGWALCDGTNGTPDLRNRFIVGAGDQYNVLNTGGAKEVTLTQNETPIRDHSHWVDLTTTTDGNHNHSIGFDDNNGGDSYAAHESADASGCCDGSYTTASGGNHSHSVSGSTASTGDSSADAHENRPPYLALAYIMKL